MSIFELLERNGSGPADHLVHSEDLATGQDHDHEYNEDDADKKDEGGQEEGVHQRPIGPQKLLIIDINVKDAGDKYEDEGDDCEVDDDVEEGEGGGL